MNKNFIFSKNISWQMEQSKGFLYIYDILTDSYFKLEDLAKDIWLLLSESKNIEEIVKSLSVIYGIEDIEEIHKDVYNFVNDLLLNHLIEEV